MSLPLVTREGQDSNPNSPIPGAVLLITMRYSLSSVLSAMQFHTAMFLHMLFPLKPKIQGHLMVELALTAPPTLPSEAVTFSSVLLLQ